MKHNNTEPTNLASLLQTSEVAKLIDRSPDRVRQLAKSGELQSQSTARGVRLFERGEVANFILRRQMGKQKSR